MAELNKFIAENAAIAGVLGFLLWMGKDFLIGFLRNDAARKLSDKNPHNDGEARLELSIAETISKISTPHK